MSRNYKFHSKVIVRTIINNPKEITKEFLLWQFLNAGNKSSNVNKYQFWKHDNKPIELWSNNNLAQEY